MRIGYVLKRYPRLSETFILHEMLELERQGVELVVFSLNPPDDERFHPEVGLLKAPVVWLAPGKGDLAPALLREHLDALRVAAPRLLQRFEALVHEDNPELWRTMRWGIQLGLLARQRGVQRLHAHFATVAADVASVAGAVADLPFSVTCHAKDIYHQAVDPQRLRRLAREADFLVTVCDANRRHLQQLLAEDGPAVASKLRRIYNGVDLDAFHPRLRAPRANGSPPLVLGVGRLVEKKGFALLVQAMAGLTREGRTVECVIVGDGEERARLQALIDGLGAANVRLLGARTQDEVRRFMAEATLLALPCIVGQDGNRDALPTVLLEALAMGLPVVSTPVVGIDEILDGGRAGILAATGDVAELQTAIALLLDDPARRAELALAGRRHAQAQFDLRRAVSQLRDQHAPRMAVPRVTAGST